MKRRLFIILCILIQLLPIFTIILNLFVLCLPTWICIPMLASSLLTLLLLYRHNLMKLRTKVILTVTALLSGCFYIFIVYCNPFWNSVNFRPTKPTKQLRSMLNQEEACEDLKYAVKYIKRVHPLFQRGLSKELQDAYNQSMERLRDTDELTVNHFYQELSGILALTPDAHTCTYINSGTTLVLKDYYLRMMSKEEILRVNDEDLEDFLVSHFQQLKYETKSFGRRQLKNKLLFYEDILTLGLDPSIGMEYTYQKEDGSIETVRYTNQDFISYEDYKVLREQFTPNASDAFSYTIDREKQLALLTLNRCTFNDEYRDCLKSMFTEIKQQGIPNIAVDLRSNGGGSSMVATEFIRYLDVEEYHIGTETIRFGCFNYQIQSTLCINKRFDDLLFHGNVYVLTSCKTFSSAMDFAQYIKDNRLGTIIGEAPGNFTNGYGEVVTFQLPNSRLYLSVSCATFTRADTTTTDELVEPDIYCESKDALQTLYEQIQK